MKCDNTRWHKRSFKRVMSDYNTTKLRNISYVMICNKNYELNISKGLKFNIIYVIFFGNLSY